MTFDEIQKARHYNLHESGVECIEAVENMGFCLGNAIKYLWRVGKKGPDLHDLKKVLYYLKRLETLAPCVPNLRKLQEVIACEPVGTSVLGDVLRLYIFGEGLESMVRRVEIQIERESGCVKP